jgi:PIN domain nuclease of toxin-antitoxin system
MPTILDTHAWIWWVTGDERLSNGGRQAIRRALDASDATISAISIWEVAKKVEKRQIVLDRPVHDWLAQASSIKGLYLTELSPAILIASCSLPQPFHGDPADQMIAATARHTRSVIVTRDRKLRNYPQVQTVW